MQIFILMQNEGKGVSKIRDVYLKKQDAEDFIGMPQNPTVKCDCCGQQTPNPKYYDDATERWKRDLFIKELTVK